jgi:DNA-binding transcriptional ArsR family regulator
MKASQGPNKTKGGTDGGLQTPRLTWDIGTAYDLFVSLAVLHEPDRFGLRGSWAAGVRSRFPPDERRLLEEMHGIIWVPMEWIHNLPEPKDAASAIWALRQLPPSERLPVLTLNSHTPAGVAEILHEVAASRTWDQSQVEALRDAYRGHEHTPAVKEISQALDWWSRPEESGELFLSALQTYQAAFFGEEEKRITPALQGGLENARELSKNLSLLELVEELSQGVHFDEGDFQLTEVVLAPTYWSTPLVIYTKSGQERMILLFGVRPAEASLVPGEQVPDALLQALKAMADPTRLSILSYLARETLAPSELSRRLRLRAPTVTHHLNALRLAGLVRLTLHSGGEKRYTARLEGISSTFTHLEGYLRENPMTKRSDNK